MPGPTTPLDDLREAYERGDCVVFAGEGVSTAAGLPGLKELAAGLITRLKAEGASADAIEEIEELVTRGELIDALSAAKLALGHQEFSLHIERQLDDQGREVPEIAREIAALGAQDPGLRAVLSTSLDRLLERAFGGRWEAVVRPTGDLASRRGYLFKLRGTRSDRETWVFSREQQDRALFASPLRRELLQALLRTTTILFVGCDLEDLEEGLLAEHRAMSGVQPSVHYALVPDSIGAYARRRLEDAGVRLIRYPAGDPALRGAAALLRSLREPARPPEAPARRPAIPHDEVASKLGRPRVEAPERRQRARELLLNPSAHLLCDRADQWACLKEACARPPCGHVILICGAVDEGHSYFRERVEHFGSSDLGAEIVPLKHDIYEHSPFDVELALGKSLEVDRGSADASVSRLLSKRSVILLFPAASVEHQAAWLMEYYTKALPDFMAKVQAHAAFQNSLVAVQPAWWVPWRWPRILERIPLLSRRGRALRALRPIREAARPNLKIHIEELSPISLDHIQALFRELYAADEERARQRMLIAAELDGKESSVIFDKLRELTR